MCTASSNTRIACWTRSGSTLFDHAVKPRRSKKATIQICRRNGLMDSSIAKGHVFATFPNGDTAVEVLIMPECGGAEGSLGPTSVILARGIVPEYLAESNRQRKMTSPSARTTHTYHRVPLDPTLSASTNRQDPSDSGLATAGRGLTRSFVAKSSVDRAGIMFGHLFLRLQTEVLALFNPDCFQV